MKITALERFIVVLASYCNKQEVKRLRRFFEEWEKETNEATD